MLSYIGKFESVSLIGGILLFVFSSASLAEEYYTWVDENGIVNYSERSPDGYNAQRVTRESRFGFREPQFGRRDPSQVESPAETAPAASEETTGATGSDGDEGVDPDQLIAAQKQEIEAELAAEREKNCRLGKQNLARLEAYARIRVRDDDGEMRYLSDAEMEQKRQESRDAIKFHCR